jgi:hypothetical protein
VHSCCRHRHAAGEQPPIASAGLRFRLGCVSLIKSVAQPLVRLDRVPTPAEVGERVDQYSLQVLVEGTCSRQRFEKSESGFLFALLEQLRSEQSDDRSVSLGQLFATVCRPVGVPVLR